MQLVKSKDKPLSYFVLHLGVSLLWYWWFETALGSTFFSRHPHSFYLLLTVLFATSLSSFLYCYSADRFGTLLFLAGLPSVVTLWVLGMWAFGLLVTGVFGTVMTYLTWEKGGLSLFVSTILKGFIDKEGNYSLIWPSVGGLLLAFMAFFVVCIVYWVYEGIAEIFRVDLLVPEEKRQPKVERGMGLSSSARIKSISERLKGDEPGLTWGIMSLPEKEATKHFVVVGATGSGKTLTIRQLLLTASVYFGKGRDRRALIYDAKQDMYPVVCSLAGDLPVHLINPFDSRGVAWDISKDVTTPSTALQIAGILIPEESNTSQPFFSDAARHLLSGVMRSFIQIAPKRWTFRDVLLALRSKESLEKVLLRADDTKDLVSLYLSSEGTTKSIMSTLATKMQRFEFVAAAWEGAKRSISLNEWITSDSYLVLGNDERTRSAVDAINQVIVKRLSELLLSQKESFNRKTWLFLDEVRAAGRLEGLSSLLTKGRSKGVCVVLGFQDIEGMREVYNERAANELVAQCGYIAILRNNSPKSAEWGAKMFGSQEVVEYRESTSTSKNVQRGETHYAAPNSTTTSSSISEHRYVRETVLPAQIQAIEPVSPEYGLGGYYRYPGLGECFTRHELSNLLTRISAPKEGVSGFTPIEDSRQYLKSWDEADLERLFGDVEEKEQEKKEPSTDKEKNEDEMFLDLLDSTLGQGE